MKQAKNFNLDYNLMDLLWRTNNCSLLYLYSIMNSSFLLVELFKLLHTADIFPSNLKYLKSIISNLLQNA